MMKQAKDFLDESEALFSLIEPLSEDALNTATLFKGWSISDIIGHLHLWNWAADLSLKDAGAFKTFWGEVSAYLGQGKPLNQFEKDWLKDLQGKQLVDQWRAFYIPMAERFGESDPAARVVWAGPDMSVRSSITARLMETWAHGQAIYDVMALDRQDGDRIHNIVVLGTNTYAWTFKNRKMDVPGPMPYVKLTAPSGEFWTFGDIGSGAQVEGSATAFCQVVTQTRNISDVDLKVTGDSAVQWMNNAQCFAGPPETPPPPGTRKKAEKAFQTAITQ